MLGIQYLVFAILLNGKVYGYGELDNTFNSAMGNMQDDLIKMKRGLKHVSKSLSEMCMQNCPPNTVSCSMNSQAVGYQQVTKTVCYDPYYGAREYETIKPLSFKESLINPDINNYMEDPLIWKVPYQYPGVIRGGGYENKRGFGGGYENGRYRDSGRYKDSRRFRDSGRYRDLGFNNIRRKSSPRSYEFQYGPGGLRPIRYNSMMPSSSERDSANYYPVEYKLRDYEVRPSGRVFSTYKPAGRNVARGRALVQTSLPLPRSDFFDLDHSLNNLRDDQDDLVKNSEYSVPEPGPFYRLFNENDDNAYLHDESDMQEYYDLL